MTVELAEIVKDIDMYDLASKTINSAELTEDETVVASKLDEHFKKIGKRGCDPEHEIAAFVETTVNTQIDEAEDAILDILFDRGTVGAYDDFDVTVTPKNTLVAYECAAGGNVPRSFVDVSVITPTWFRKQIETDIRYSDLERNGWKTVATITDYAVQELRNQMFAAVFDKLNGAITSGADNYIAESTAKPTQASADAAALYVNDHVESGNGVFIARSKYIQNLSKMSDATAFLSSGMKDKINQTGFLGFYDGVALQKVSSANTLGDGKAMFPDKVIFGVAGKIGTLNTRGDVTVYEEMDNNKEVCKLMFKNFSFGIAFNKDTLEKVCKIQMAQ